MEDLMRKSIQQTAESTKTLETLEIRLDVEKKENAKLYTKLEEKYSQIKDLESKLNMTQMELSKKSQKISQVTGSMFLYQSQLEKLRQELDDERASSANEISHLNAIISEKNSVIEKLKNDGAFEKEQETFQTGLTLDTLVFDSILDFEDKPADPQIPKTEGVTPTDFQARRQSAFGAEELSGHLGSFIRTKINSRNFRSRDFAFSQTEEKDTQTDKICEPEPTVSVASLGATKTVQKHAEVQTEGASASKETGQAMESSQAKLFEVRLEDMSKQVAILRSELQNTLQANSKLTEELQQKEGELGMMTSKLLKVSEESTIAFDLINGEYEKAIKLIKQLKKSH